MSTSECIFLKERATAGILEEGMKEDHPVFWTVGHSTRTLEEFLDLLVPQRIEVVADVRHFPGSRRYPWFNQAQLEKALNRIAVQYLHFKDLGGRRRPRPDSRNTAWREAAFRGYADYMASAEFKGGIARLETVSKSKRVAIMCAEAVWWRCHRSLISDYLKAAGYRVIHILGPNNLQEHPFTSAARFVDGKLSYER